jgi:choloylglycine hydrolase
MLGLPGDATPPSRFVRATAFTQSAIKPKDSKEAVNVAFHIANNFDIPKGFSRANENGTVMYDFTFWTTLAYAHKRVFSICT